MLHCTIAAQSVSPSHVPCLLHSMGITRSTFWPQSQRAHHAQDSWGDRCRRANTSGGRAALLPGWAPAPRHGTRPLFTSSSRKQAGSWRPEPSSADFAVLSCRATALSAPLRFPGTAGRGTQLAGRLFWWYAAQNKWFLSTLKHGSQAVARAQESWAGGLGKMGMHS